MRVYLIGAGVVGLEILKAHLDAGLSVCLADQSETRLREALHELGIGADRIENAELRHGLLPAVKISASTDFNAGPAIVIESIVERLDAKQAFFREAERWFGEDAILCSNTSTLRISHIAAKLSDPTRMCGLHFFMPVGQRDAVEIVRGEMTDDHAIEVCLQHAKAIGKDPIVVADKPGFIVNRLLCPYLNQALLLLAQGVSAEQLERAALRYGMPMSPLELMDWIGTRTMFDAGRVFWQSFPSRFDPTPILPALVKAQRFGRVCGRGCYDYQNGDRSEQLSRYTQEICERYQRGEAAKLTDEEVMLLLAIPMWIEAAFAFRERVAEPIEQFDVAMSGGLGYRSSETWLQFFDDIGSDKMLAAIDRFGPTTKALTASDALVAALKAGKPTAAMREFAKSN
jgi:3-hydroxyacyl-CoA dehydrogenase